MANVNLLRGEKLYLCEKLEQEYKAKTNQAAQITGARESHKALAMSISDYFEQENKKHAFKIEGLPKGFDVSDGQLEGLFKNGAHRAAFIDACYVYLHGKTRADFLKDNLHVGNPFLVKNVPPQYIAQNEALTGEKEAELTEEIETLLKKVDALEGDKNKEIAKIEGDKNVEITKIREEKDAVITKIKEEKDAVITKIEGEKTALQHQFNAALLKAKSLNLLKWAVPILLGLCVFLMNPCKKAVPITWYMTTTWDGNTSFICEALRNVTKEVSEETNGDFRIMISNNLQLPDEGRTLSLPEAARFVSSDTPRIQMIHSSKYYYHDSISPSLIFFSAIPFGMDYKQTKQWIGDRFLESERGNWAEGYRFWQQINEKKGIISFPCGHSDAQWGGWYKKPILNIEDFKDKKVRIAGFAGRVLDSLGAKTYPLFQYQLLQAMQSDSLFAAEWINAVDDYKMGLYKARSYKWVNNETWNEPNSMFEMTINRKAFNALPARFQKILVDAIKNMNKSMSSEFAGRGQSEKYENLIEQEGVKYFKLPPQVRDTLEKTTRRLLYQHVQKYEKSHPEIRKIYDSYLNYCPNLRYHQ